MVSRTAATKAPLSLATSAVIRRGYIGGRGVGHPCGWVVRVVVCREVDAGGMAAMRGEIAAATAATTAAAAVAAVAGVAAAAAVAA